MGVHESNQGLCAALLRGFETLKCSASDLGAGDIQSVQQVEGPYSVTCKDLLARLIDRNCSIPSQGVSQGEAESKTST